MDLNLKGTARQTSVAVVDDGVEVPVRVDRTGVNLTWKEALLLEGRCFTAAFGEMGATDITELTAGSDLDQPDFCVSVPTDTTMVLLEVNVAGKTPLDANDADCWFIVVADPDAAYAADGTVTSVTPVNCITSGPITTQATCFEDASGNVTDPTCTKIIVAATQRQSALTTSGVSDTSLEINYAPEVPLILVGPAAIYGFGGGTDTVTYVASVKWAEVPSSRFSQ